jgi:CRISPR-associated protein Cas1
VKKPVCIFNAGGLQRHQNTLRFTTEEGPRFAPLETTSEIHAFGEAELNTRLLDFLSQNNIPLRVYNYYGYRAGSCMPREQYVSGHLSLEQAGHYKIGRKYLDHAQNSMIEGELSPARYKGPKHEVRR